MKKNASIRCSVSDCKFNAVRESYCTLEEISVGKHMENPTRLEETDCESFKVKNTDSMS